MDRRLVRSSSSLFLFFSWGRPRQNRPLSRFGAQVDTITQVNKGRSLQPWHLPSNLSLPTMAQQGTGTADILLLHGLTTKTRGPSTRAKRVLCVQLLHLAGKPTHLSCAWRIPSLLFSSLPSSCLLSILSSPFPTSQQIAGLSFVCNCCRSVSKQLPPPLQAVTYPNHIRLPGISLKRPPNNETRFVIFFSVHTIQSTELFNYKPVLSSLDPTSRYYLLTYTPAELECSCLGATPTDRMNTRLVNHVSLIPAASRRTWLTQEPSITSTP